MRAMSELVKRARDFATRAHTRINHRRKYTKQPYEVHLKAVATTVSEIVDDEEMIAAAWLHDTVEDTEATHRDIELEFGAAVSQLVSELTDISKPSDGNRAARKALDRQHLAKASVRGKTIKLADLIDNTRDICKHDAKFAKVFVAEAQALIEVISEGDERLLTRLHREIRKCSERLEQSSPVGIQDEPETRVRDADFSQRQALRLFTRVFSAGDIAEPLRSFDSERPAPAVLASMGSLGEEVIGVRHDGLVEGYVWKSDLDGGQLGDVARAIPSDQIIASTAPLSDVILVLTHYDHCFITVMDAVAGVVARKDTEKPIVRMWLFGMITMMEMNMVSRIRARWPGESWTEFCGPKRLEKARAVHEERRRRAQDPDLLDCLQFADKARIVLHDPKQMVEFGFDSRRAADGAIGDLESLRNNLAHGQDIATYDWPQIVRMTQQIERLVLSSKREGER
jgi:hypothetical protein